MIEALERHSWPGNIRELRNVIERGVILSSGESLTVGNLTDSSEVVAPPTSLAEVERDHILKTLQGANWRVKGPYGAAKRLQVNPITLYSRMGKLDIRAAAVWKTACRRKVNRPTRALGRPSWSGRPALRSNPQLVNALRRGQSLLASMA